MMGSAPLVSIIIPTYNYAHFIAQAVQSVLTQQYAGGLEIIVVDDGSTDGTQEVLAPFIRQRQVRYYYQSNEGKAAATQRAVELATGNIIFNLDADDWYLQGKIQQTVDVFASHPEIAHVAHPAKIVFTNNNANEVEHLPSPWLNKPVSGLELLQFFMENNMLYGGGSTFAAKASVLKGIHWHKAVDMHTDEWLLIQTLLQGNSYLINKPLSVWRVHGKNFSKEAASTEILGKKHERLLQSSVAVLQCLSAAHYPHWLHKAYYLKHQMRILRFKEEAGKKTIADTFDILVLLLTNKWQLIKAYHVFNRLLPVWLSGWLKTLLRKQ